LLACGAIAQKRKIVQPGLDKSGNNIGVTKMTMTQILVDTDILIDVANNDAIAKARLTSESQTSVLAIGTITIMELIVGCRNKTELQSLNRFLSQFQILTLTSHISERATQLLQDYYLSHRLLIADALIAATAIENQIALLSKNQRDFRFIQELNLLPYP
jgi:predicted nucleic acid-binding protein